MRRMARGMELIKIRTRVGAGLPEQRMVRLRLRYNREHSDVRSVPGANQEGFKKESNWVRAGTSFIPFSRAGYLSLGARSCP